METNQSKVQETSSESNEQTEFYSSTKKVIDLMKNLFAQKFSVKEILTYTVKLVGLLILLVYSFQFKIFYLFILFIILVLLLLYISRYLGNRYCSVFDVDLKKKLSSKLSKLINNNHE